MSSIQVTTFIYTYLKAHYFLKFCMSPKIIHFFQILKQTVKRTKMKVVHTYTIPTTRIFFLLAVKMLLH